MLRHIDVCRQLEHIIAQHGSLRQAALSMKVSPQLLSAALAGERSIGPKLLKALKLRRTVVKTVTYEELRAKS